MARGEPMLLGTKLVQDIEGMFFFYVLLEARGEEIVARAREDTYT
jgi:hypothetical protein